jgi:hypothetical protein
VTPEPEPVNTGYATCPACEWVYPLRYTDTCPRCEREGRPAVIERDPWDEDLIPEPPNEFSVPIMPAQADFSQPVQLEAMLPVQEPEPVVLPPSNPDVPTVEAALIVPGDNDRQAFEPVALQELADSIAAHGLAQPITVRPIAGGLYQIVAGERRFRAMQLLGWERVPALVRDLDDRQASAIMLVENLNRVDLNPIDEARAYSKRMTEFSWAVSDIAHFGKLHPPV